MEENNILLRGILLLMKAIAKRIHKNLDVNCLDFKKLLKILQGELNTSDGVMKLSSLSIIHNYRNALIHTGKLPDLADVSLSISVLRKWYKSLCNDNFYEEKDDIESFTFELLDIWINREHKKSKVEPLNPFATEFMPTINDKSYKNTNDMWRHKFKDSI